MNKARDLSLALYTLNWSASSHELRISCSGFKKGGVVRRVLIFVLQALPKIPLVRTRGMLLQFETSDRLYTYQSRETTNLVEGFD